MAGVSADVIGFLSALWRYPVKSMMGEELDAGDVNVQRGSVRGGVAGGSVRRGGPVRIE